MNKLSRPNALKIAAVIVLVLALLDMIVFIPNKQAMPQLCGWGN